MRKCLTGSGRRNLLLLLLAFALPFLTSHFILAQDQGIVRNSEGFPVANVNIMLKNGSRGTTTDNRGHYIFKTVPSNDTLVFSAKYYFDVLGVVVS